MLYIEENKHNLFINYLFKIQFIHTEFTHFSLYLMEEGVFDGKLVLLITKINCLSLREKHLFVLVCGNQQDLRNVRKDHSRTETALM